MRCAGSVVAAIVVDSVVVTVHFVVEQLLRNCRQLHCSVGGPEQSSSLVTHSTQSHRPSVSPLGCPCYCRFRALCE